MIAIIVPTLLFSRLHDFQRNLKRRFLITMTSISILDRVYLHNMRYLKIKLLQNKTHVFLGKQALW